MANESLLMWVLVGVAAGWLASRVVGGGSGLLSDLGLGIVGSLVGTIVFRAMSWHAPLSGLPGRLLVAFVGAVVLILGLRLLRRLVS